MSAGEKSAEAAEAWSEISLWLHQLTGELAKPAIRLDDERKELSILLLSPCKVLAVLSRLGAGSSA